MSFAADVASVASVGSSFYFMEKWTQEVTETGLTYLKLQHSMWIQLLPSPAIHEIKTKNYKEINEPLSPDASRRELIPHKKARLQWGQQSSSKVITSQNWVFLKLWVFINLRTISNG